MEDQARKDVQREILARGRVASIAWLLIVAFLTFQMYNATAMSSEYSRSPINSATKTWWVIILSVVIEIGLVWVFPMLMQRRFLQWGVICLQLAQTIFFGTWLSGGQEILFMGMLPLLLIEGLNLVHNKWRILVMVFVVYSGVWISYGLNSDWTHTLLMAQASLFTTLIVIYYWRFYTRQVDERLKAEKLLMELQLTYKQLEVSAARNERERMARELHDTLTQGLAGVVMQLEAADTLLDQEQSERAKPIIKRSIVIARQTLRDSRLTLTDLRSVSEGDLGGRLQLLTETFQKNYGLVVQTKLSELPAFSPTVLTEVSRCLSEALTNVVKHAQTDTVIVRGQRQSTMYQIQVVDFGRGFKMTARTATGHFGFTGLRERMQAIGGQLQVSSEQGEGTTVTLKIPMTVEGK